MNSHSASLPELSTPTDLPLGFSSRGDLELARWEGAKLKRLLMPTNLEVDSVPLEARTTKLGLQ